jgi:hypothetical protein
VKLEAAAVSLTVSMTSALYLIVSHNAQVTKEEPTASFLCWEVSRETHVEDLNVGSGGVVVSQALQSYQGIGKKLVRSVYSAEIKTMRLLFVRGHDKQVVLSIGTREDAGASDQLLGLLETVRELRGGGSGRNHSHDSGVLVDHTTIGHEIMKQKVGVFRD